VTCADNINARFQDDFKYLCLPLLDTPTQNILQYFNDANKFINEALSSDPNARVLIHCFAGKSRASTITTQFLMANMKIPLDQALRHVKACRPIA
jgi:protein-tyrosine phosphatase